MGHGDVSVNKKMKDIVKLFNEILIHCETWNNTDTNSKSKYLAKLFINKEKNNINLDKLLIYIDNFISNIEYMSLNLLLKGIINTKK